MSTIQPRPHETPPTLAEREDRLITWPEVAALVPVSRVTIWHLRRSGGFPQAVKVSPNRIAWRLSEVRQWIASREIA